LTLRNKKNSLAARIESLVMKLGLYKDRVTSRLRSILFWVGIQFEAPRSGLQLKRCEFVQQVRLAEQPLGFRTGKARSAQARERGNERQNRRLEGEDEDEEMRARQQF
jgi:hypothetical protein